MRHVTEDMTPDQLIAAGREQLMLWRDELAADSLGIQTQLGVGVRTDGHGRRLPFAEWTRWREGAKFALQRKLEAVRRVKTAIATLCERERLAKSHRQPRASVFPMLRVLLAELDGANLSPAAAVAVAELRAAMDRAQEANP
jgi:hypothetical protein